MGPLPPSVLPGLGPGATREAVDPTTPPWRGVVRVQTEIGVRCTGALVAARLVLTAAHCLFGRGTGQLVRPASIHVLSGYSRGDFTGHARATAIETGPGFALGADGQPLPSSPLDADWAILTLDTPLGTPDRLLPLLRALPAPGTGAMLPGYEQDRAQILVADVACTVLGAARAGTALLLRHSCAATRGASGGPLLVRTAQGDWAIAGVAAAAERDTSGGYVVPAGRIPALP